MSGLFGKLRGFCQLTRVQGSLLIKGEDGQTLVEYAIILVLVALALIFWLNSLAGGVNNTFNLVNNSLQR